MMNKISQVSAAAAAFAGLVMTASASFAASVPAPSVDAVRTILSTPPGNARVNRSVLDPGDVGHVYLFSAPIDLAIIGSGTNNSRSELLSFARTGDRRNGGSANPFVDDGEAANRIDLEIGGAGSLSDDLAALVSGLGTDWLSAATIAPGEFLAFNVLGTRSSAPIDTVVFYGDYFTPLYGDPLGGPSDNTPAPVPLPAGILLLLTGLGGFALARRFRSA